MRLTPFPELALVIYRDEEGAVCHAGIVVRKNVLDPAGAEDPLTVLSKWGADGEYVHALTRLPALLGTPVEYWTGRREP